MPFLLAGLGTALPPHAIDQSDAAAIAETISCETDEHRRLLPALYRRTGVGRRQSVLLDASDGPPLERQSFFPPRAGEGDYGPTTGERMRRYAAEALPLATRAASAALADASFSGDRVTHLVTVSCSGFAAPGWDVGLIDALSLSPDVARTHVGFMGCHGALNGLRVAKAFTDANPDAAVLVTALELCSLHHRYGWEPDRIVSNALFADASAAVLGLGRDAKRPTPTHRLIASGSTVVPDTTDAMSWHIGDHGFEMSLSPRVPELIHGSLRPWLEGWLAGHGVPLASVASWAVHPGGPRILSATAEGLDLPPEALADSRDVLREHGNMSSPTILFILDRLRKRNAPRPAVALGFGPGLTIEAALFG